jgi:hypothetical protein
MTSGAVSAAARAGAQENVAVLRDVKGTDAAGPAGGRRAPAIRASVPVQEIALDGATIARAAPDETVAVGGHQDGKILAGHGEMIQTVQGSGSRSAIEV